MDIFDNDFKEIFSSEIISIAGGLIAGTLLASYTNKLFILPGMLIILPAFLDMRGNISGTFSSRLTSGLYLGVIKPKKMMTKIVTRNIIASFLLAIIVALFLGLVGFLFNFMVLRLVTPQIIIIPLVAGIIASAIELPISLFMTFQLFRKGHDPNNIMGPFVTSTGDITSILALLIAMMII